MFEFIFECIGELFLQIVFEVLGDFGYGLLREPFRSEPNPWIGSIGYAILGLIAGGLSLLAFPTHFITGKAAQVFDLFLIPVLVGLLLMFLSSWRRRTGLRLERFVFGFLFVITLMFIRYKFAG